jgi:uncharacterized membrane protein YqjE
MFTNEVILAFLAFACAVGINRILAEKALKRLSVEEKAKLLDSFSGNRIYSVVVMLVSVLVFFIVWKTWPEYYTALVWTLVVILFLNSLGNGVFSYMKLKKLAIPKHYISNFLIRCIVYYGAFSLLIVTIASQYFPR